MYSVKQLGDKIREEQFDVKNFPVVCEMPSGKQYPIVDVVKDDENRQVVLRLQTDEEVTGS